MGLQDVFYARDKLIKNFSERAQNYHARQQQYELERDTNKGKVELDVNTALQKLRNEGALRLQESQQKGAMELQDDEQAHRKPFLDAQIAGMNIETKAKDLDLSIGKTYSGGLVEEALKQKKMMTGALADQLATEKPSAPAMVDRTRGGIEPLPLLKEKINLLDYHPISVAGKAVKSGYNSAKSLMDYIKQNFYIGLD